MAEPLLTDADPSQTIPKFDASTPVDAALGGSPPTTPSGTPGGGPLAESSPTTTQDKAGMTKAENANGKPAVELTPELVNAYQTFVANGMKLIHAPETRDRILEHLKTTVPPERALGDATLMIIKRIEGQAQQQGIDIPDIIKLDGSNEIMGQLYEVGEAAGVFQLDDQGKTKAYGYAIQQYIKEGIANGTINPEEVKQGVQMLSQRMAQEDPAAAQAAQEILAKVPDQYQAPQQPAAAPGAPAPPVTPPEVPAPQAPAPAGLIGGA